MKMNKLTMQLAVAPQIGVEDIPAIKQKGFKTIICNRPDGEESGQQSQSKIKAAAEKHGLQFAYQPVINTQVSADETEIFAGYLDELPKPILAYCRTGTRSTVLWAMGQKEKRPVAEIVQLASQAGYDLSTVFSSKPTSN
jgi:sulfide:quinone oxidoreductase